MKIRTDFVTNSSSSSFCLEINIELRNGEVAASMVIDSDYYYDEGGVSIEYDPNGLSAVKSIKSVEELYNMLMAGIQVDSYEFEDFDERPDDLSISTISKCIEEMKATKDSDDDVFKDTFFSFFGFIQDTAQEFLERMKNEIPSTEAIAKITIIQSHSAYGECFDLVDYLEYPKNADLDTIREHLKNTLSLDSDIEEIVSCITHDSEITSYSCDKTTTIDTTSGNVQTDLSVSLY